MLSTVAYRAITSPTKHALIRAGVGAPVRKGASMLKVVHEESEANATGGSTGSSAGVDRDATSPHPDGRSAW